MVFGTESLIAAPDLTLQPGEIVALTGPVSLAALAGSLGCWRVGVMPGPWRGSGEWWVRELLAHVGGAYQPDELLSLTGLTDEATCRIRALSPGRRRRLAVAVAIATRPEVLLLADPTSGLPPEDRRDVHVVLDCLAELERMAIVFTTQDPAEAYAVADRVVETNVTAGASQVMTV